MSSHSVSQEQFNIQSKRYKVQGNKKVKTHRAQSSKQMSIQDMIEPPAELKSQKSIVPISKLESMRAEQLEAKKQQEKQNKDLIAITC